MGSREDIGRRLRLWRSETIVRTRLGARANLGGYRYAFSPEQLWALCSAAEAVAALPGAYLEVGVASGETTVYLNKHLAAIGKLPQYVALDTFSGFTKQDISEEHSRGRTDSSYENWFTHNSAHLYHKTLDANGLSETTQVIQADAASFDYTTLPPLAFVLADVDLYRPMSACLSGAYDRLVPGGIVIADDCSPTESTWRGAREAYLDFCEARDLRPDIRHGKLGYLSKPS